LLVAPHIESRLMHVPTAIGIREFLTATLATQIFVMPILLYQIGQFSVVSVLVNVLVLPMVPVAMFLTFIAGMIVFVSHTLAMPVAFLAHLSLSYIITVATFFASLPFASFVVPAFPFIGVVAGYGFERKKAGTLSGWVIEEEKEILREVAEIATAADTPVFFR
jgi:competence protein ComEC